MARCRSRLRGNSASYDEFKQRLFLLNQIESDEQIKSFFAALCEGHLDAQLKPVVKRVLMDRPTLTNEHLAYLLFAAFQYLSNCRYDSLEQAKFFEAIWDQMGADKDEILDICLNINLSTQIINRYAALQIILAIIQKEELAVIDLGCAAGMGLMSLNTPLLGRVETSDPSTDSYLRQDVSISKAVGIDKAVLAFQDLGWIKACIPPACAAQRKSLEVDFQWLMARSAEVDLIEADILDIPQTGIVARRSMDVIWTSNTLYQIGNTFDESLELILPVLNYLLAPDGLWIDAYYRYWDSSFGADDNPYQVCVRSKQDFNEAMVVLISPDDGVSVIHQGKDYHAFLERYGRK